MSKTSIALIKDAKGVVTKARIDGAEVSVKMGAPAEIGGTLGVNLFVEGFSATASLDGVEVPVHQIGHAVIEGRPVAIIGIKDANITFETAA